MDKGNGRAASESSARIDKSLPVAEVFGKEHNKVCRDIETLNCSLVFSVANFGETYFRDSMNREQKAYLPSFINNMDVNQYDIDIIDADPIVLCSTIVVHLSYKTQA